MEETLSYLDYRHILIRELERRTLKNPSYSLRAFARDLKMSPSRLSDVINGRYGFSHSASLQVAERLELPNWEREQFVDLVQAKHARSLSQRKIAQARLGKYATRKFRDLKEDIFQMIADWYHMAILELTALDAFEGSPEWISQALGINKKTAQTALDRLLRLNLLKVEGQKMVPVDDFSAIGGDTPSAAIKEFHSQILLKAQEALISQEVHQREFGSVMLAFDRKNLVKAKAAIRKFRREFSEICGSRESQDSVYCLAMQFFDLTKDHHEKQNHGKEFSSDRQKK